MVYKHRTQSGKVRHYQSRGHYERSLKGMFANGYQKKNHSKKIAKIKAKKRITHRGIGKVSSGKKFCETCKAEGKDLTKGRCKVCAEEFASFKQPEIYKPRDVQISKAIVLDNYGTGDIADSDIFQRDLQKQIKEFALKVNYNMVHAFGKAEAEKMYNESNWGDDYFVVWGFQTGNEFAFIENRRKDRYIIIRNDGNDPFMDILRNGVGFKGGVDVHGQLQSVQSEDFISFDLEKIREKGEKIYNRGNYVMGVNR